jgi:hypothetical protein
MHEVCAALGVLLLGWSGVMFGRGSVVVGEVDEEVGGRGGDGWLVGGGWLGLLAGEGFVEVPLDLGHPVVFERTLAR